jgi:hypothetical protein
VRNEILLLTLLIGSSGGAALAVAADPAGQQSRIDDLIAQLGSKNYRLREAATKNLDAIGEAALEPLRKAVNNPDMEIADRAASLVTSIEQRAENARLIAPTYVDLTLKDSPVEYAVAELAKKSGYPIAVAGDKSKLAGRKVTLETGKVPFWKAFEMLCEKAEIDFAQPVVAVNPAQTVIGQGKVIRTISVGQTSDSGISLVDGKPKSAPMHVEGAVRIRAVDNADLRARFGAVPEGEIPLFLAMQAEPKIQVVQVIGVRIDQAIDNNDQRLTQSMVVSGPQWPADELDIMERQRQLKAQALGRAGADRQTGTARMKRGEKASESIKELHGVVSLKIRTGAEELAAVENIMKAKGQSAKGKFDATLKIIELKTLADGDVEIGIELQHPQEIQPVRNGNPGLQLNGNLQINGNVQIQIAPAPPNGGLPPVPVVLQGAANYNNFGLELIDAKGAPIKLAKLLLTRCQIQVVQAFQGDVAVRTTVATMAFHPERDQEAAKLVFRGTRLTSVDVPFVLNDVPVK